MGKRKKKRIEDVDLPAEELLRRQRQRELQAMAIQMRCEGKPYNRHRAKAKLFKADNVNVAPRPSQALKHKTNQSRAPGTSASVDFQVLVCLAGALSLGYDIPRGCSAESFLMQQT
jgi:hypothetical protein